MPKIMYKKSFFVLIFIFLFANYAFAEEKPKIYMPYPIVFVSGIKTSSDPESKGYPSKIWPNTTIFKEFQKYFQEDPKNLTTRKYGYEGNSDLGEVSHLEFFFYDAREDTLKTNAEELKKQIEKILFGDNTIKGYYEISKYAYTEPCSTPKVILVCHSYGGLIARYMLAHDEIYKMQDKVAAVFFLGVPQEGSPLAAIGYFLPKEILALKEDITKIEDKIDSEDMELWKKEQYLNMIDAEEEKITGNLNFMIWAESSKKEIEKNKVSDIFIKLSGPLYTSTRDSNDTKYLEAAIKGNPEWEDLFNKLPPVREKGTIKATLINDALANKYRHTFKAYSNSGVFDELAGREALVRSVPEDGPLSYDLGESELSKLGTNLGKVEKVHAIVGTDQFLRLKGALIAAANLIMGAENFNRDDYSCIRNGFWIDGDGVVSLASQEAIPGYRSENTHVINAAHSGDWGPIITGETDHPTTPNIILQAIDDKPVIEDVRIITSFVNPYGTRYYPFKSYIIVKVKDYLLADIEFETDILASNLHDYYDSGTGKYKPYFKLGKDFLKERDDKEVLITDINGNVTPLHLQPGEFYLKVNWPFLTCSNHIKLRNPAKKEVECLLLSRGSDYNTASVILKSGGGIENFQRFYYPPDNSYTDWMFDVVPFSSRRWQVYNEFLVCPNIFVSSTNLEERGIGACLYAYAYWRAYADTNGYPASADRSVAMYLESSNFINFPLNVVEKEIKSAKLTGYINKTLKGGGNNFIISVSRDSSNIWPASLNSSGDTFLFNIDTSRYRNGDYFEFSINPANINPNGNNVWQSVSNISLPAGTEGNCIPDTLPYDLSLSFVGYSNVEYKRSTYIAYPSLIIFFE